jgi:hypothetical protein
MHIIRGSIAHCYLTVIDYLLYDLNVLSSITKKGEIEEYLDLVRILRVLELQ